MEGILQTKNYVQFSVGEATTFEGAQRAKGCLPGDSVTWDGEKCTLIERSPRWSLPIPGILALASKTTYGITKRGHPLYLFHPINKALPCFIVGSSEKDKTVNRLATVFLDKWETGSQFPRGNLVRMIGAVGDLAAEQEALLAEAFPWPSLRKKVVDIPPCPEPDEKSPRLIVEGFTFNIDPPGCRDIDDCISIVAAGDSKWEIAITIADVAERIEELGALDLLAATFGQTVYRDGEAVCPMLPPSISEEACSLVAGQDRHGVSLILSCVSDGGLRIVGRRWAETIIHNDASFTYEDFYTRADGNIRQVLQSVSELCGASLGGNTHDWIEALMLEYNREAGALLSRAGCGILRRHASTDMAKMEVLAPLGLQALAQQSAEYCLVGEQNVRHWGIGADHYAHASSPLRRYADLMNQRLIKQIIRTGSGAEGTVDGLMVTVDVSDLNMRGRAVKQYEKRCALIRNLLDARKEGQHIYDGTIVDRGSDGAARVWITELKCLIKIGCGVDGSVGNRVRVEIGLNLQGLRWANRIVRRIVS